MPATRKPRDPFEIIAQRWATYRITSGADVGLLLVTTADYEDEVAGPFASEEIAERIVTDHNASLFAEGLDRMNRAYMRLWDATARRSG